MEKENKRLKNKKGNSERKKVQRKDSQEQLLSNKDLSSPLKVNTEKKNLTRTPESEEIENFDQNKETHDENTRKRGKQKKKKLKPKTSTSDRILKVLDKKQKDDGLLLSVVIHKTDQLRPDVRLRHPVIRVYLVNEETGQSVKKTDPTRNVTKLSENEDYILPVMTQPYDLSNRGLVADWQETLIYNEVYSYFLQRNPDHPKAILLFELVDFAQMSEAETTVDGWHRIAWAFLKIVSPTGVTNTDKKIRLQFYQPVTKLKIKKEQQSSLEIYQWWRFGTPLKYPCSLHVTVKGVHPPENLPPTTRSLFPTQKEQGGVTFQELSSTLERKNTIASDTEPSTAALPWTKLSGQINRIPTMHWCNLPITRRGCSAVRFSNNGKYIACACATKDYFSIYVYEHPDWEQLVVFTNHFGIIYDLHWSTNDRELLSSSADCTVRCWDMRRLSEHAVKLLPHPCYVYTARYHPRNQRVIVTAAFDHVVRVWSTVSNDNHALLLRELRGHNGFVNSIVFNRQGDVMYSGDGNGCIIEWYTPMEKKKKNDLLNYVNKWDSKKTIDVIELKETIIDTLLLHPNQMKLLVHTRDSLLRMLDLRSYGIQKVYSGGFNFKEHLQCCLSPCGSLVFCGAENGRVLAWNTETGQLLHTYGDLGYARAVCSVDFHPHDNYIAFACFGESSAVKLFKYHRKNDEKVEVLDETIERYEATSLETQRNMTSRLKNARNALQSVTQDGKNVSFRQSNVLFQQPNVTLQQANTTLQQPNTTLQQANTTLEQTEGLSTWGSDFTYNTLPHTQTSPQFRSTSRSPALYHDGNTSLSLHLNQGGSNAKPLFKVNQAYKSSSRKKVVALYEYSAGRSDELSLHASEVLTVLYEDNKDWWMGENQQGGQGYFPASYVINADCMEENADESTIKESRHLAVSAKDGSVKILSGSDSESSQPHRKKRTKGLRK